MPDDFKESPLLTLLARVDALVSFNATHPPTSSIVVIRRMRLCCAIMLAYPPTSPIIIRVHQAMWLELHDCNVLLKSFQNRSRTSRE